MPATLTPRAQDVNAPNVINGKNPKYNIKGDGSDEHVALQAWLNDCAGAIGSLSPGTYVTSAALAVPSNTELLLYGVIFKAANGATAMNGAGVVSFTSQANITINGLTLDGNSANQTASSVTWGVQVITPTGLVILRDVTAQNTAHIGIYVQQGTGSSFIGDNVSAVNCGSLAIVAGGSEGIHLEQTVNARLVTPTATGSSGHGIYVPGGSDNVLVSPTSNNNGKRGIYMTSPNSRVIDMTVQNNGWTGVELDQISAGSDGYTVIGGDVSGNGTAASFVEGDGLLVSAPRSLVIGVKARNNGTNAAAVGEGHGIGAEIGVGATKGVTFVGCESEGNGDSGFIAYSADSTRFIGCVARNNGKATGAHDAAGFVLLDNTTTPSANTLIQACRAYDDGTGSQLYGVNYAGTAAGTNNNRVIDSDLTGNHTAPYLDSSGGSGNTVQNTMPYGVGVPTPTAGPAAGTTPPTPTMAAGSNDQRGRVNVGTGSATTTGGLVTVTFAQQYAATPHVVISPANSGVPALGYYLSGVSVSSFVISVTGAPAANQAVGVYSFEYVVVP